MRKAVHCLVIATSFLLLILLDPANIYAVPIWAETYPTGIGEDKDWTSLASDSDGTHLIAAVSNGRVYLSSDSGTSWDETYPTGIVEDKNWVSIASDSDGTHLIAAVSNGQVYLSSNSGTSWDETYPTGFPVNKYWQTVASDDDGSHLIVAEWPLPGGRVYSSSNGGTSWTQTYPTGIGENKNWKSVASDSDGSHLMAAVNGGRVYLSSDSGTSWNETYPTGIGENKSWESVASDSDGTHLIAAVSNGRIYLSSDSGTSWDEAYPTGSGEDLYWISVASDSDGSHLMASVYEGRIYLSSNSGTSWDETYPTGSGEDKEWQEVASDDDGSLLMAAVSPGRIYLGVEPTPTPTPTPTTTSSTSSSSGESYIQIPEMSSTVFNSIITSPIGDSNTGGQEVLTIIPPQAIVFDAYLSSQTVTLSLTSGVLPDSLTGILPLASVVTNTLVAGDPSSGKGFLGIKAEGIIFWQVGNIQNIWYKAYAPGFSTCNSAKIIPELQFKFSIIALKYQDHQLIPPGKPKTKFTEAKLKLAHSLDGKTWKILDSVVDPINNTVATIAKVGGYYMIVGRY